MNNDGSSQPKQDALTRELLGLDRWLHGYQKQLFPEKQDSLPSEPRRQSVTSRKEDEYRPSFDLDEAVTLRALAPSGDFYEVTLPKGAHVLLFGPAGAAEEGMRVARIVAPGLEIWVRGPRYVVTRRRQ